jgi:hypothetical protein
MTLTAELSTLTLGQKLFAQDGISMQLTVLTVLSKKHVTLSSVMRLQEHITM